MFQVVTLYVVQVALVHNICPLHTYLHLCTALRASSRYRKVLCKRKYNLKSMHTVSVEKLTPCDEDDEEMELMEQSK